MATAKRYRKPDPRIGTGRARPRRRGKGIVVNIDGDVLRQLSIVSGSLGALDKAVHAEYKKMVRDTFTEPLAAFMRADALAAGRHGPRAAKTIKASLGAYPQIRVGSLGEPTWAGAVFGGQRGTMTRNRKDWQSMSWPNSGGRAKTRKVIRRRQTMQFLPHRGQEGYLVFPTWRRVDRMLSERLVDKLDEFVAAVTLGEAV